MRGKGPHLKGKANCGVRHFRSTARASRDTRADAGKQLDKKDFKLPNNFDFLMRS
jgi:hypothetical protein